MAEDDAETIAASSEINAEQQVNPATQRRRRIALGAILLLSLCLRLAPAVAADYSHEALLKGGDSYSYINPAIALLDHHEFNTRPNSPNAEIFRTPGYPIFIAAVWGVFGRHAIAVVLVQILVSLGVVLLVYWIGRRWWSAEVGLIAAAIVAIDPYEIRASGWMMTESLAAAATVAMVYLGYKLFSGTRFRPSLALALGFAIAVATLLRPTTYYFPVVTLGFVFAATAKRRAWRELLVTSLAIMLPIVLVIGGWQLRNHQRADTWRFSAAEAAVVYYYHAADVLEQRDGISWDLATRRLQQQLLGLRDLPRARPGDIGVQTDPPPAGTSLGTLYDRMYSRGVRIIVHNPPAAVISYTGGLLYMLVEPGTITLQLPQYFHLQGVPGLRPALLAVLLAFYAAVAYGVVLMFRKRGPTRLASLYALAIALYVLLLSGSNEYTARFRVPVMPILALFAAEAVAEVYGRSRRARVASAEPIGSPDAGASRG